uniref:Bm12979, isoform c n=1 Tax=Brugia malayi TaxID=6279 RepID=A0A1I9G685_BRUMA|nr:Bm12979, isoform c [Brugia malayi]
MHFFVRVLFVTVNCGTQTCVETVKRTMITVYTIELCNYGKQIAPALMVTLTAVTTISILLCKAKKNITEKRKDSPNTESISIHGQVSSVSNGQNLCSTSFNKNSNLNTETISFIPINQNQQSSSLIKKAKDDATPLFSESTEEDAMTEIVKEKRKKGIKKEKSNGKKRNFDIESTQRSISQNRVNTGIKRDEMMTKTKINFMADLPIDSSQASDLHSANIWLDEIETKTMREIPVDKLLSLKKSLMPVERNRLQTTENVLSDHSNISLTGDEEAQSSSDETDESEETRIDLFVSFIL